MADKTIGQLVAATNVTPTDLFVLEQSGTAKKLTGQILENWLLTLADGHGGIQSIAKTGTQSLVDTYTITLADNTTATFTVTNGKAISSITTYYVTSTSGSTVPSSGWSTTRQSMTSTKRYLWSYQHIAFNDNSSIDTVKTVIGVWGDKGDKGDAGVGIVSLTQTSREPGQYTLYTFLMTDGSSKAFYSYDGVGITGIDKTSSVGLVDLYTISYSNGTSSGFTVTNAKSITSVTQTGSSGVVDTYTVSFNDGTSTTFNVTNGSSIQSITKTGTQGLVDTYTVALTDGTATTFTVTNAKSITRITQTGGTHAAGTTDTYTIYFNDGDTATFSVYNGTNGTGSVSTVDGIQPGGNQNVTLLLTGNGSPTPTTPGQLYQRYFDLSTQILYICIGVDTTTTPTTYSWVGTGVPVDASLSSSSENPVQNKVITGKVGTVALNTTAQNLSGAVNELNNGKVNKSGDTMTGQLNVGGPNGSSSYGTIQVQGGDKTVTPTGSNPVHAASLKLADASERGFGFLRSYQDANGRVGVILYGLRADSNSLNAIRLLFSGNDHVVEVSSPSAWRNALSLGAVAVDNTVPITHGGTGATTAAGARTSLGLVAAEESATINANVSTTYSLATGEHGVIVAAGLLEATRGLIIYHVASNGTVGYTMLGSASSVDVTTATNSIKITNNSNVSVSLLKMTWQ